MSRRNYSTSTSPLSATQLKQLKKAERKYPGGSPIPLSLPTNYKQSPTEKKCHGCKFFKEGFCNKWKASVKPEYVCNSWLDPSEGINNFKLIKESYIATSLRDTIDTSFSEFGNPPLDEDIEQFFQIYREIFYEIPKRGEQSHTTLINDSKGYIENYVDPKDTTILILNTKIQELQEQIEDEFTTQQHPYYPDGTVLHVLNDIIGIMQDGHFREIEWHVWEDWSGGKPEWQNPVTGEQKSIHQIAQILPDTSFLATIKKNPNKIRKIEDFNDYSIPRPTNVINFNKLRNDLDQFQLDAAEIEQLRLLIETKVPVQPGDRIIREETIERGGSTPTYG